MTESSNQTKPIRKDAISRSVMINLVIPVALLCAAAMVVFLIGTVEPEKRPDADNTRAGRLQSLPPVRVEQIRSLESTGEQLRLEVDGAVVPYREARVAAEVAGRVIFKADECEAGSYVRKNQVLMRIDPTDYEIEVQRLGRLREQEYQALGEVDQEIVNAQRLVEIAKQDQELQEKEMQRLKALPNGFSSPAEIDKANRALLAATQQLVSVENQVNLLRKRRVRLEASEQLAVTQLKAAEVNLKRTEILAPIDGVIVNEDADMNTFVARGSMLVTIEDTSKVEVAANLRMDQLHWVLDQQGKQIEQASRGYDLPETPAIIEFELSGRQGSVYRWQGCLMSYDGIGLDPATRTVPVRVVVDNPLEYIDNDGQVKQARGGSALVRGMFVRVYLLIEPKTKLVVIPARALQPGNRVFQFVPDESVLVSDQEPATQPDSKETSESIETTVDDSKQVDVDPVESKAPVFDPQAWEPGRVYVRSEINPVEALTLNDKSDESTQEAEAEAGDQMWVCEVRGGVLQSGAFVVVSPMGSIDAQPLSVRADRSGMSGDTSSTAERERVESLRVPKSASRPDVSRFVDREDA
jgi:multidrug efflux pump subunit AcrA (membrane-fusion protein)